ncbi:TOBE domain-containing protein [Haloarcula nitratireducens]|uniref:TOBE domain-containing protein n=1 Tax=Haloarcula nitratireducens TaxID=2487749 RepID=A0AAW4PHN8_9EURY|nr:TOBE domain-containing protein [Halomicroarcula nitratireducens]MBX0297466.1 TOBE domain-containing protein [Halomicroarcula nitratireducens]
MDAGFEAHLRIGSDTFNEDDAALLRAIDDEGSLNAAASSLGRSYSRVQKRITALESELGPIVKRRRGGDGGGGSQLTDDGRDLLTKFARLQAALEDTASVEEVAISGTVVARDGELATVETAAGTVRALVSDGGPTVHVVLRADAITLHSPASAPPAGATSARNRFEGTVDHVQRRETTGRVVVDVAGEFSLPVLVTRDSLEELSLSPGDPVVATFKATATRALPI